MALTPPPQPAAPAPTGALGASGMPDMPGALGMPGAPGAGSATPGPAAAAAATAQAPTAATPPGHPATAANVATVAPLASSLQVSGLHKRYGDTPVFTHVSFSVARGEFVAIVGESGVGKSTLLNCLAGLDHWDQGEVALDGQPLSVLGEADRALWRRRQVGFVFQAFHVLPHLDVAQNIALPLLLLGQPDPARVAGLLHAVGLDGLGTRLPAQLSGGQLQRVALARALVHRPALLLADEPTGNLDPRTAERVLTLLQTQARAHGAALLLVTHSEAAAARADRVLHLTPDGMADGGLQGGFAGGLNGGPVTTA